MYLLNTKKSKMNRIIILSPKKALHLGCPVGYHGIGCKTPCRYPNFGQRCQQLCNCTKDFCDPTNGCRTHQGLDNKYLTNRFTTLDV